MSVGPTFKSFTTDKMKSKVKHNNRVEQLRLQPKPKMIDLDNEERDETYPLEYNFSTKNAQLKGTTYTFAFPDMWRTSKNKNIIGIRKINYFKGSHSFTFALIFMWKPKGTFIQYTLHIITNNKFGPTATIKEMIEYLNEQINKAYADMSQQSSETLTPCYYLNYDSTQNILKMDSRITPIKDHKIYINAYNLSDRMKAFFDLYDKPVEHITAYHKMYQLQDLDVYDISNLNEMLYERISDFQVCCSFVAQSDIQYVGLTNQPFVPIKYYELKNENRYFTMKLKTNEDEEKTIPPLENDRIIIEAQLL